MLLVVFHNRSDLLWFLITLVTISVGFYLVLTRDNSYDRINECAFISLGDW
jgi:hypothetical protein